MVAIGASALFLIFAAAFDALMREEGVIWAIAEQLARIDPDQADGLYPTIEDFLAFFSGAVLLICAMPVVFIGLIGEIAQSRSFIWYIGGTGLCTALIPWLIRGFRHMDRATSVNQAELHFAMLFFLTGAMSGLTYWAIAGRGVCQDRPLSKD
jgi:hypothetical protein